MLSFFVCCEVKKADDKESKGMDFYLDDIFKMKLMGVWGGKEKMDTDASGFVSWMADDGVLTIWWCFGYMMVFWTIRMLQI